MCFYNSFAARVISLAARYNRNIKLGQILQDFDATDHYIVNGFSFPDYPVITAAPDIEMQKWGLIPFWTKDETQAEEIRRMTLNARSDTIFSKPSFREPVLRRRCLIPSTGYFEWRHEGKQKIPYRIFLKDEPVFSMGGIYDVWHNHETDTFITSFSIITTDTNPLIDYVHNQNHRMPLILAQNEEEKWLDPHLSHAEIQQIMTPFPEETMAIEKLEVDFLMKWRILEKMQKALHNSLD